jgi:hypothetical protein
VKLKHWILFVVSQSDGLALPRFGNVHSNIIPLIVGPILLLPGSLIGFLIQDSSWWGWYWVGGRTNVGTIGEEQCNRLREQLSGV